MRIVYSNLLNYLIYLEEKMNVLVINCGSSSIKYQVMDPDKNELLCKGLVELLSLIHI